MLLLQRLPAAWFPPYSIFWFMHALMGCTLLAWLFRKYAAPRLGRWSDGVYVGLAMFLFLAVNTWRADTLGGAVGEYVETILYWNRFFGLGMLLFTRGCPPCISGSPGCRWRSRRCCPWASSR